MLWKTGVTWLTEIEGYPWLTEIEGYPIPKIPSKWAATNATPGSFTASANV